jgi:hypothetical protein
MKITVTTLEVVIVVSQLALEIALSNRCGITTSTTVILRVADSLPIIDGLSPGLDARLGFVLVARLERRKSPGLTV